ncbi:hypothetical protein P7L78_09090 [Tistrella bauzanensis]|uniref:hypothetical protein n=1 Tax=Tistrella TaxID=171436 RepID=UPI0031F6FE63
MEASTHVLDMLRDGRYHTLDEIAAGVGGERLHAMTVVKHLCRAGYLARDEAGYRLTTAGEQASDAGPALKPGPRGRRGEALCHRLWQSMRIRKRFTIDGLLDDALRPSDHKPARLAMTYIRPLVRAGYLVEMPRPPTGGDRIWRLIRDTGPLAPTVRTKVRIVHDNNTGEDFPC